MEATPIPSSPTTTARELAPDAPGGQAFADVFGAIVGNVERVIQGKPEVIELVLLCLLAEGHLLIEDVPGVGKTSLAKALSATIDCTFGRVQFTPDLLPTDVMGVSIWNRGTGGFEFRPGPVFANIVLADEINRASPKTQSALLEAMAEAQVTVDGSTYRLAGPFMVIATQNPIEHVGPYPLPESQLDRFLMRVAVGYPGRNAEIEMLDAHGDHDALDDIGPVVGVNDVAGMIKAVRTVHMAPSLKAYLVDLAEATRRHSRFALGVSPRAVLSLQRVARARAAAAGRAYVIPDDMKALIEPVLAHRLIVTPEAQLAGVDAAVALREVLQAIPIPGSRR
ncbi:MAG: AAA family ATPase [Acidimicrobiales bacterium]